MRVYFLDTNDVRYKSFRRYLSKRMRLIYDIGTHTGLRISDILNLKYRDITLSFTITEIKTGKSRTVKLTPTLVKRIKTLCCKDDKIFGKLTRQAVWKAFKQASKKAGVSTNIGTHSMRKNFAHNLLKTKHTLSEIAKELNHDNLNCVLYYLIGDDGRL